MNVRLGSCIVSCALLSALLCVSRGACAQSSPSVVSLDPVSTPHIASTNIPRGEASFANAPANFFPFASARVGEPADIQAVHLRFSAPATLTGIESTKDFPIQPGGSCVAGNSYAAGDTCIVLVRFTPQGAGRRLGKLTVHRTGSPQPDDFGLGGYGYAPVVSFNPAVISTVSGTYPSGHGLLSGAKNLTVDGSDTLYIADTGNGIIRYMDSGATIKSLATGYSSPNGIAVDTFGEVYFDETAANIMYEIYDYGPVVPASGTTVSSCTVSAPCNLDVTQINLPGEMSIDPYNHLFFVEETEGAAFSTVQPEPANLIFLYDPFPFQDNPSTAMAVDANDNLYTLWSTSGNCEIQQQSLYNAENEYVSFNKVAGGRICGYSGDGGEAGNAEIGSLIGQIDFDVAGNLYFSDTNNQRVRMINATTGIINTVAGNGNAGYSGDGFGAKSAKLSYPTGVTVDSQGQVYIISGTGTTSGGAQVVRKVGPNGYLSFGSHAVGSSSSLRVTVSNTGNTTMTLSSVAFTGTDASDFSIDTTLTSCLLTAGSTLYAGQTCQIGVSFKPGAAGTRSGNLVLLDNTVNFSNTVQLAGTGTSSAPSFSPPSLTFPVTSVNQSASASVTVTNNGTANLSISSVTVGGSNPKMFTYTSACTGPIAPKASCQLQVTFKPTTAGSHSAVLNIADNAPSSPHTLSVAGTGLTPANSTLRATSSASE